MPLTTRCNLARNCPSEMLDRAWVSTLEYHCSMRAVWPLFSTSRLAMFHLSFMSHLIPSLRWSGSHLEIFLHPRGFKASSPSRLQGIKQPAQGQGVQQGVPFLEFDLERGEAVKEGEAQAPQTPLPVSAGEQEQEHQSQFRRSPTLNKIPEVSTTNVTEEPSNGPGSKVCDVWYKIKIKT